MSEIEGGFDTNEDIPNEYDALPPGDYVCMVVESESKDTSSGSGKYLKVVHEILSPEQYKGRKVFNNINYKNPNEKAQNIGKRMFKELATACGIGGIIKETAVLHNIPIMVRLDAENDPKFGNKNIVKKYYSTSAGGSVASSPSTAPAPGGQPQAAASSQGTVVHSATVPWGK